MANLLAHDAGGVELRRIIADNLLSHNLKGNEELENALKEMLAAVKEDERALYKRLAVGDYKGFINKLEQIKAGELDFLLSTGEIVKYYVSNYTFPQSTDQDETIDYLRQLIELHYDDIISETDEELQNGMIKDITEEALAFIRQDFKSSNTIFRYFGKGRQRVGLAKIKFSASIEEKNGIRSLKVGAELMEAAAPISKKLLSKVLQRLRPKQLIDVSIAFPKKQDFKDNVDAKILSIAPLSWKEALNYAIKGTGGEIEISRSYAGLVGYLGEIRSTALLYRLFGTAVQNSGALKDLASKQQISIDTVIRQGLNYLGFQVKNYTLNDGKTTFTSSMSVLNFISNRLCLTGTLEEVLSDLLGVYQFNQPFTNEERFENHWMTVQDYRDNIYTQVQKSVESLSQFFETRLGNIIRIGSQFGVDPNDSAFGKIFGTPKMYYNSFFLIADKYIPSSVILESLLAQLQSGQLQKVANIQYSVTNDSNFTLENYYQKIPSKSKALEKQKIHYNVILDVQSLVNKALQGI